MEVDDAWEQFVTNGFTHNESTSLHMEDVEQVDIDIPKASDIYISTQTKIAYLNQTIPLNEIFWKIPIINYQEETVGTVKKQMKINCITKEEVEQLEENIAQTKDIISVDIISQINNPNARKIKFKDVRKINIGICKKDLISYRTKRKGAFYNCFALIIRIKDGDIYRECHIKIFNTGKLEIPGIQSSSYLYTVLDTLVDILQPYLSKPLKWDKDDIDTVLINSNFSCNYYIDRNVLAEILKYKYNLHVVYDPCSYPGIQCKFYYNENTELNGVCECVEKCNKKGSGKGKNQCLEVSFMIFRTGSVLIVGHCDETILYKIYNFLKEILTNEYSSIHINTPAKKLKPKNKKVWKKYILVSC